MEKAQQEQVEREPQPVGSATTGPHLEQILRRQPEEAAQFLRDPLAYQSRESTRFERFAGHVIHLWSRACSRCLFLLNYLSR